MRISTFVATLVVGGTFSLLGCGASVADATTSGDASPDDGPDTSTLDALDARGDGGCVNAVEGAACTTSEAACMPPGDPCCIGYIWTCSSNKWVRNGLGCACMPPDTGVDTGHDAADTTDARDADAGPFVCGSTTCGDDQICTSRPPGIPTDGAPTVYYSCMSMPAACVATPTCDCVKAHVDSSCYPTSCTIDASGHVTLECMGV